MHMYAGVVRACALVCEHEALEQRQRRRTTKALPLASKNDPSSCLTPMVFMQPACGSAGGVGASSDMAPTVASEFERDLSG